MFAPHRPEFSTLFRCACWANLVLGGIAHQEDAFMRDDSAGDTDSKAAHAHP